MSKTAYLCLTFQVLDGIPIFQRVRILDEVPWASSEPDGALTTVLWKEEGVTQSQARENVRAAIHTLPSWEWMKDHLSG